MIVGENYEPLKFPLCTPNCRMSMEFVIFYIYIYGKCMVGIISPWKICVWLCLCMERAAISCTISYSEARKMTWVSVCVHAYVKRSNTGLVHFFSDFMTFEWGTHEGTYVPAWTLNAETVYSNSHLIDTMPLVFMACPAHMPHSMNIKC